MKDNTPLSDSKVIEKAFTESAIRIGLIFLLALWSFKIFQPFLNPVVWATILAVALYPLYRKFEQLMKGRSGLAVTVFTLLTLALLIVPTILLFKSLVNWGIDLAHSLQDEKLVIPSPAEKVATWPIIGGAVYKFWDLASSNLEAALRQIAPQLKAFGGWLLGTIAGVGSGVLQSVISIIIAGLLMANAKGAARLTNDVFIKLVGERGEEFASLSGATIRSVAQGVLGTAMIQALLCGIGMLVAGIPGAGFWTLLVLIVAIVQLPATIIMLPIIIYAFSVMGTVGAVIFTIWSLLAGASDNFLKPLLLGRGVAVPMLVILIGAIGGMLFSGIVGLFTGAVILAVAYKLFIAWVRPEEEMMEVAEQASAQESEEEKTES